MSSFMSQLLNKLVCYSEIAVVSHRGEMSVFTRQTSSVLLTEVPLGVTKTDSVFNFPSDGCAITSDYKCVWPGLPGMNHCPLTNKVSTPVNRNMGSPQPDVSHIQFIPINLDQWRPYFPGNLWPVSKGIFMQKHSYKVSSPLQVHLGANQTHFQMKSFAWRFVFIQMHKEEKEMAWYCVVLMELGALQRERKTILLCSGLPLSYFQGACMDSNNPLSSDKGSTLQ